MKRIPSIVSVATVMLLFAQNAFSWGQKGHDIVCAIAEKHLTEKARVKVTNLLEGKSMVYWANWLDNASNTPEYSYSLTWHYRNVDADQTYDSAPLCEKGDIVRALSDRVAILCNKKSSRDERTLALKMVIHLLGDMHQPLHMGHQSDRGGNLWKVKFFGEDTDLHTVWDNRLVDRAHDWSHSEWVEELDRMSEDEIKAIQKGQYVDWAKEAYKICTRVYNTTPEGSELSYSYVAKWTPIVEQQFLRAGYRLASVLNRAFK